MSSVQDGHNEQAEMTKRPSQPYKYDLPKSSSRWKHPPGEYVSIYCQDLSAACGLETTAPGVCEHSFTK